jgi:hypothetical protein
VNLLSPETDSARNGKHRLQLEPYGYRWYSVGSYLG